ncbi:MAG: hypothetical protein K2X66_04150 [Cyanobacteria bacterium]|nr:hypothetical protein [Cyanobacteriota bacterium]
MLQRFMLKSHTVSFRGALVVFNFLLVCAHSQGFSESVTPSSEVSSSSLSSEKQVQNAPEKISQSATSSEKSKSNKKRTHLSKGSPSEASTKNIPGLETVVVDPSEDVVPLVDEKHPSKEVLKDELQKLVELQKTMQQQITELQAKIEKTDAQAKKSTEKINMLTRKTGATGRALDTLLQRTKLSGYVEQGWRAYTYAPRTAEYLGADGDNGNTFNLRKYVVRNSAQFSDKASWVAEVEYEDAGKNEITVEQSEFIYNYKPWLTARAGLIIPTVTPTNVNHEGTNRYLVDRPLVDQLIMPTTYRDLGVGISGFVPVLKKSAFN